MDLKKIKFKFCNNFNPFTFYKNYKNKFNHENNMVNYCKRNYIKSYIKYKQSIKIYKKYYKLYNSCKRCKILNYYRKHYKRHNRPESSLHNLYLNYVVWMI